MNVPGVFAGDSASSWRKTDNGPHIAIAVPSLEGGGAERVAETLAREFLRKARVTVVTMEPRLTQGQLRALSSLPGSERIPPGCRQVHLPSSGDGSRRLGTLVLRFAALARREKFDAVYSFLTWTNVLVATAKLLGGRYVHIASEHALADSLRTDGARLASLARTLPLVYLLPDWIVVVSPAVRQSLLTAGVLPRPDRAVIIANPVNFGRIISLAQEPTKTILRGSNRRLILCVARLHVQKDHATLFRAMSLLPDSFMLALAGDGPLREQLQAAANEIGVGDRVVFLGAVQNPYPLMLQADVVVLASREEGFGLVAVEAAALNVPFVGSDVGGLREVCDVLGHRTFPVGDHVALAALVADVVSHPREPALKAAGERYEASEIADRYLQLAASTARCGSGSSHA